MNRYARTNLKLCRQETWMDKNDNRERWDEVMKAAKKERRLRKMCYQKNNCVFVTLT